jgi:hypothetical protein
MRCWMLDRTVVGRLRASMRRTGLVLAVPALMAASVSCGSSSSDTPVTPGDTPDASADVVSDARPDAQPDAADADSGPASCVPATCASLDANCGSAPDGCGGKIECGDCPNGMTCGGGGPNKCGTGECVPKSCVQVNASCGWASDGCSMAIDCGGCPPPSVCGGGGQANQCGCVPKTCAQLGANCGTAPDGCFGVVDCGNCLSGQTCGGGGPNKCGTDTCKPKTCAQVGASCGYASDGCSTALDCGECTAPSVCGGGGVANQCGCTPKSCAQLGASCGTVDNGCETTSCGECVAPDTCGGGGVANQCGCVCSLPHAQTYCQHGECSIKECDPGWGDCDSNPSNGCEVDLRNTVTSCGACGVGCSFAHATARCVAGSCQLDACAQDYDNCDGDDANGCEANLRADPNNCNTCGHQCPALGGTPVCNAGVCGVSNCNPGKGDCDPGVPGCETDTTSSVDHCGFCNNPCSFANAKARCVASSCQLDACNQGYGDCDSNESNGCEVDTNTSVANCGACDKPCPSPPHSSPTCINGTCGYACDPGWKDCDGQAGNGCEVNTNTDLNNCGACGSTCSVPNGSAMCSAGSCIIASCNTGFADCNHSPSDGCEVNTTNDVLNCGGCGAACSSNHGTPACTNSTCSITCNPGYQNCDGKAYNGCEVDVAGDPNNCGGCGKTCSNNHMLTRTCAGGVCNGACANNFGDCDNNKLTNGCESDLRNNPDTCGGCGQSCSSNHMQTRTCTMGVCSGTCSAGYDDCNGNKLSDGCEVNLNTDPAHCGSCINQCSSFHMATVTCSVGVCSGACENGWSDCDANKLGNGCETNVASDPNNCGSCSTVCSSNNIPDRKCSNGVCSGTCSSNWADCDNNKQVNGCEVNLLSDSAHCGDCSTNCNSPPMANVQNATCNSGSCVVSQCVSGYYNQDNAWSSGCECGSDTVANVCGSPTDLGTVNQGSTSYYPSASGSYTIAPTGGGTDDEDWFTITFANSPACTYKPRIQLVDLSGTGLLRMQLFTTSCGTATQLSCNGSGESGNASNANTTWEFKFSGTCGAWQSADPYRANFFVGMINSMRLRVYTTASSTTCLPYRLVINNGP